MTTLRKLFELPLGSWFRYPGARAVRQAFILIDRSNCGTVTHAPTPAQQGLPWAGQGIYSAADSQEEFRALLVEFVPVIEKP